MAQVEDLEVFFSLDEFAVLATLDDGQTMPVIFDRAHLETLGVSTTSPAALARTSDVADKNLQVEGGFSVAEFGDLGYAVAGRAGDSRFVVRDLQQDGTGLTLLILEAP